MEDLWKWTDRLAQELSEMEEPRFQGLTEAQLKELGIRVRGNGELLVTCGVCEFEYELPCDVDEFDQNFSYCGGSPRCCP